MEEAYFVLLATLLQFRAGSMTGGYQIVWFDEYLHLWCNNCAEVEKEHWGVECWSGYEPLPLEVILQEMEEHELEAH